MTGLYRDSTGIRRGYTRARAGPDHQLGNRLVICDLTMGSQLTGYSVSVRCCPFCTIDRHSIGHATGTPGPSVVALVLVVSVVCANARSFPGVHPLGAA
jgi:hypothetical protein